METSLVQLTTTDHPTIESTDAAAGNFGAASAPRRRGGALRRLFLGAPGDPRWLRPAFWLLLAVTAAVYLTDLTVSGYANSFYAAAVQAGAKSWKAWFFGSLDSANFITVDKPPASLWVMGLSARLFGFSSFSLLFPQALMAVGSVALTWGAVRRTLARLGATTANVGALVAGFVVAFTPAAAMMFRFDNPDALLVLLMTAGAYCVVRGLPKGSWRWIALAGVALGFAFLTKMLQGLLVLPAFAVVYLLAARTGWRRRVVGLLIAAASLVVSAGWWVLAVALWPASARPYIGGSTDNTVLELVFGYNGLGRIFGGDGNGGGGAPGGGGPGGTGAAGSSFGGSTGLERLFSSEMGLEASWLIPAALIALVLGLVVAGRRRLSDPARAGLLLWGGWLVVTGLVFSYMSGTIHPYYTVALVPAIGGLVGTGGAMLWKVRGRWIGRGGLAAMIAASAVWAWCLLNENPSWQPWLRWMILAIGILSAAAVLVGSVPALRKLVAVGVLAGLVSGLAGTTAYSLATATVGHTGSIPSVGPAGSSSGGFGGGMPGGGQGGAPGGAPGAGSGQGPQQGGSSSQSSGADSGSQGFPGGGTGGPQSQDGGGQGGAPSGGGAGGADGMGGGTTSSALTKLLASSDATWAAAVNGSQSAAQLELDTGTAVMAIGGWSSDPAPTLAQFKKLVAEGKIGYYISSGGMGGAPGGGSSYATQIEQWVAQNFTARTVGGQTVYELSSAKS
ncbi:ArnT family glycosyltransferase [Gryllotalpicola koreensis]|uniref:Glycosyl transferase n=1 Tax=Gryllotalpicola koreensis TaxID=993086 RepID=A0ABP7ZRR2_9MICO